MSLDSLICQSQGTVQTISADTPDAAGAYQPTWTNLYTSVWARIEVADAARVEQFARMQMNVTHELFTFQSGIRAGMRWIAADGKTYAINGDVTEPATGRIPTYYHFVAEEQVGLVQG